MLAITLHTPCNAGIWRKACDIMDVILHLGAHRTASTSFQNYMRENAHQNAENGLTFWGPWRTRNGMLTGVVPCLGPHSAADQFDRACGRIALQLKKAEAKGVQQIVVSDENMIGSPRQNLRARCLYGGIGERMARYAQAFGGAISRVVLSVRCQGSYWGSVLSYSVARGHSLPVSDDLDRLVTTNRQWRGVIADLACAVPQAEVQVQPYEVFGARPEARLSWMTGRTDVPRTHAREWINRAPDVRQLQQILADRGTAKDQMPSGEGRWQPFNKDQTIALREAYADDLHWLRSGADGLVTLIEETGPMKEGKHPPIGQPSRGQTDDIEVRQMA